MKNKPSDFYWIDKKRKKDEKEGRTEVSKGGFYDTKSWRQLRASILDKQPFCGMCLDKGFVVKADVVDHIEPVSIDDMSRFLDPENCQPLCYSCHYKKTAMDKAGKKYYTKEQSKNIMSKYDE